jgi:bifunctional NMN adenylyltransferase/nudix hydrolase
MKHGVVIGSFSPPNSAHLNLISEACSNCEKVVVVIGSKNRPRTKELPFTVTERISFISSLLSEKQKEKVIFSPVDDYLYNNQFWASSCSRVVSEALGTDTTQINLFGTLTKKTQYLKMFPQWKLSLFSFMPGETSAILRKKLFTEPTTLEKTHPALFSWAENNLDIYSELKAEYDHYEKYYDAWKNAPYPPIFHTVDAIVIKSGHILLIKRKTHPGKGLWALPGGFLDADETCLEGAIRELKEETHISVDYQTLLRSVENPRGVSFDHPKRSLRGRTITTVFLINLGDTGSLPSVKTSDETLGARWQPINTVAAEASSFFEDHFDIISWMISKY